MKDSFIEGFLEVMLIFHRMSPFIIYEKNTAISLHDRCMTNLKPMQVGVCFYGDCMWGSKPRGSGEVRRVGLWVVFVLRRVSGHRSC